MCIKNKIEAIMLLGGDEIKIKDLAKHFSLSEAEIISLLRDLKIERKDTGINVEIIGENAFLTTNPKYGSEVNDYFEHEWKPRKLSASALETLSIIAYKQPITKREIEAIRGVAVDGVIFSLEEKKFIRACGKKETKGRPNLYEITDKFLGYIGVSSIEELPSYQDVKSGTIFEQMAKTMDKSKDKKSDDIEAENDKTTPYDKAGASPETVPEEDDEGTSEEIYSDEDNGDQ